MFRLIITDVVQITMKCQITDMTLESEFKATHTKTCIWLETQSNLSFFFD